LLIFPTPLPFGALAPICSLWNFALKVIQVIPKGLSSSEDRVIVAVVVLTQCQRVTYGRTDRQTEGFTIANTALCIANYADAL